MITHGPTRSGRQRAGGVAALYLGAAFLLAMPLFLVVVDYPSAADPAKKVALLATNHVSMHAMYLVTYVIFGIVLAVLALSLYQRLKTSAPFVMQVATAVGLMWALVLVASGMVFNAGMAVVVDLTPGAPIRRRRLAGDRAGRARPRRLGWRAPGGLWLLLVGFAALRGSALPKPPAGWDWRSAGGVFGGPAAQRHGGRVRAAVDRVVRVAWDHDASHGRAAGAPAVPEVEPV